ncbi:MAG TPA: hypothetical protein VF669_20800 [Tepidisphaeraceae bacterium]|jgi:hypothetical protein
MKKKDPNVYPPGLNRAKVEKLIAYYDQLHDVDLAEDPNHEWVNEPTSWLEVPVELVPQVKKLIARHKKSA